MHTCHAFKSHAARQQSTASLPAVLTKQIDCHHAWQCISQLTAARPNLTEDLDCIITSLLCITSLAALCVNSKGSRSGSNISSVANTTDRYMAMSMGQREEIVTTFTGERQTLKG